MSNKKKESVVSVRLTEAENELIRKHADAKGMSISAYMRWVVLREIDSVVELSTTGGDNISPGVLDVATMKDHLKLKALVDDLDRRLGEIARVADQEIDELKVQIKALQDGLSDLKNK